jgi:hypothetical protein
MRRVVAVLGGVILVVAALEAVQQGTGAGSDDPSLADADCAYAFSSGAGASLMAWCVSTRGNLTRFESPAGFEHIRLSASVEGYVLCAGTTYVAYDIAAGGEFGWAATTTAISGPTSSGVTLRRFTADGAWRLDQKFSRDNKENDVTILMTLTALRAGLPDVRLMRVFYPRNDNDFADETFDRSDRTVWSRDIHAVALSNITFPQPADATVGVYPVVACSSPGVAVPTGFRDLALGVTARLGAMSQNQSKKTTFVYRRL